MHEPVASTSSDESLGEVDDEEALHERFLSYETMKRVRLLLTLAVTEFYFHYYFVGRAIHYITSITNNDD